MIGSVDQKLRLQSLRMLKLGQPARVEWILISLWILWNWRVLGFRHRRLGRFNIWILYDRKLLRFHHRMLYGLDQHARVDARVDARVEWILIQRL